MNFMFEWQEQYLTSERSELVRYCFFPVKHSPPYNNLCYYYSKMVEEFMDVYYEEGDNN